MRYVSIVRFALMLQQHGENRKLKRQSQMLLEKLNGTNKPLRDVLPDLTDISDELSDTAADDSSVNQLGRLVDKINSLLSRCLTASLHV